MNMNNLNNLKKQTIYNDAFSRMHRILSAYGLSGEMRYFGRIKSYDIRMHDMIIGSLYIDCVEGAPFVSLSGGVVVPFFHHDKRRANLQNAIQRFERVCSMLNDDYPYSHIEHLIRDDIRKTGR